MTAQLKSSFHISLEKVPRIASILVFVVGCIVLAGWQFDVPALTSILPGMATMKANSAVAFILCAIALWSLQNRQTKQQARLLANACATLTVLRGPLTLSEYIFNRNLGIDQLLFKDTLTAACFCLAGTSLWLLRKEEPQSLAERLRHILGRARFLAWHVHAGRICIQVGYRHRSIHGEGPRRHAQGESNE